MANGGAFGNPLTTGIALNFEVDMTPYRQMMRDNLQFAQTQAAERKKKQKEFQDILKNVAYDDSKIHQRMRDDARNEYAATINDVIELNKKNDYGGIMNRIAKFDSKLNNYVDATSNFRAYEKASEDGKSWTDMNYINAYNNPEKFDDSYLIENFSDVALYDKDAGVFSAQSIPKQDEVAFVNKYMQGMKDQFMRDDEGKIKRSGFLSETGDYAYLKAKSQDPESFYQELGIAWLGGGANNVEHMRRKLGLKPEDLEGSIDTPSGPMAKSAYYATEFMKGVAEPKMYSEELRRPAKEEKSKGWTFGGGGAKSPNWEVNKVSNIPVSLTDEVGGSLSGWKVDYTKQTGVSEIERNIELGKGAYFAEGGSKIQKVSDAASGLGKIIKGTPAGIYVRDDKEGGQVWVAYETNYIPPTDDFMKNFKFDPNSSLSKEEQKQVYMDLKAEEDKDLVSKTTKRIVYVPITSDSEKIEFRTTMGMSEGEFNQLIDMIGASPTTGSSLNQRQESALDAFEKQYGRQPTASERQKILKKYQ
jgi:hypothetical protein